jgi:hypothetical protein
MPDLDAFVLRSSPRVLATGRLVKGLYYSEAATGPNDMAAFHIACDRFLEPKPFLVMDFRSGRLDYGRPHGASPRPYSITSSA